MSVIKSADILLPAGGNPTQWAVIACDQFTSDPSYWVETERIAGSAPSTLRMIFPEAMLGTKQEQGSEARVLSAMKEYAETGVLREYKDSFVSVERILPDGTVRRGIVAAIDLEMYDWHPECDLPVRATELTVEERLVKRMSLRNAAMLELPHILVFYQDAADSLTKELKRREEILPLLYDFELMQGGGKLRGRLIQGENAEWLQSYFDEMEEAGNSVMLTVGDGNHSLAAAKKCWEAVRETLPEEERENHPARYALVELVNVYDEGIRIEPIHRVVSGVDSNALLKRICADLTADEKDGRGYEITLGTALYSRKMTVNAKSAAEVITAADRVIADWLKTNGGAVDYVHEDASAVSVGSRENSAYILLPVIRKEDIFQTPAEHKIFPKKCFSIGSAREKRYYMECRKIKK